MYVYLRRLRLTHSYTTFCMCAGRRIVFSFSGKDAIPTLAGYFRLQAAMLIVNLKIANDEVSASAN